MTRTSQSELRSASVKFGFWVSTYFQFFSPTHTGGLNWTYRVNEKYTVDTSGYPKNSRKPTSQGPRKASVRSASRRCLARSAADRGGRTATGAVVMPGVPSGLGV